MNAAEFLLTNKSDKYSTMETMCVGIVVTLYGLGLQTSRIYSKFVFWYLDILSKARSPYSALTPPSYLKIRKDYIQLLNSYVLNDMMAIKT